MTFTVQGGPGNVSGSTKKSNQQIANEGKFKRLNIPEMVRNIPFLTAEEIEKAWKTEQKLKLPKQSLVPSLKTEKLKTVMQTLANFHSTNDISTVPPAKLTDFRENKLGSVFHSLERDTPEWKKGIMILSEQFIK